MADPAWGGRADREERAAVALQAGVAVGRVDAAAPGDLGEVWGKGERIGEAGAGSRTAPGNATA